MGLAPRGGLATFKMPDMTMALDGKYMTRLELSLLFPAQIRSHITSVPYSSVDLDVAWS